MSESQKKAKPGEAKAAQLQPQLHPHPHPQPQAQAQKQPQPQTTTTKTTTTVIAHTETIKSAESASAPTIGSSSNNQDAATGDGGGGGSGQKSKADLRRERREIQEAQRANKAAAAASGAKGGGGGGGKKPEQTAGQAKQQQTSKQPSSQTQKPAASVAQSKPTASQQTSQKPTSEEKSQKVASLEKAEQAERKPSADDLKPSQIETAARRDSLTSKQPTTGEGGGGGGAEEGSSGLHRNDSFVTAPVTLKLTKKKDKPTQQQQQQQQQQHQQSDRGTDVGASSSKPRLFHHFEQYTRDYSAIDKFSIDAPPVHPAFIKLGLQSAHEHINGSNSRCLAFLNTFKAFLHDYKAPSNDKKPIPDDLEQKFKLNLNFLIQCRPLCISMGNAIKELKQIITRMPKDITESEAKELLIDEIDNFMHEKITLAAETISKYMLAHSDIIISGTSYAKSKITNDDCLMVYGNSSLVTYILLEASARFPNMRVVVVDARPKYKGKQTVEKLVKHGVKCTYVMINAVSFIMNKVTKVLLGAHALLANNYVVSNIGTAQIALVAKSFNVPVVAPGCCIGLTTHLYPQA